jgi:hypothetical protein
VVSGRDVRAWGRNLFTRQLDLVQAEKGSDRSRLPMLITVRSSSRVVSPGAADRQVAEVIERSTFERTSTVNHGQ